MWGKGKLLEVHRWVVVLKVSTVPVGGFVFTSFWLPRSQTDFFYRKKTYWWDVIFIMACNSILLITLTSSSHLLGGETVNFLGKFLSEGEHWYHDRCSNALPQVEIYLGMFPLPKKNREECRLIGMIVTSPTQNVTILVMAGILGCYPIHPRSLTLPSPAKWMLEDQLLSHWGPVVTFEGKNC